VVIPEGPGVSEISDPRDGIFVVERPWGDFQQFVSNERVTVKIITVQPGYRLSLQTHDHRFRCILNIKLLSETILLNCKKLKALLFSIFGVNCIFV
jgi:hypothetical protein